MCLSVLGQNTQHSQSLPITTNFTVANFFSFFHSRSNLHKHLEQEHLSYYDGYKCYMCNAVFCFYNELERHFLFNHEEGHFACALCPQNHFTQEGYRKYFFSGKYRREVLEHCAQVHNNSEHDGRLMPPPPPPPPKPFFGK